MLITCKKTYGPPTQGGSIGNGAVSYTGWAFDTMRLAMVSISGTESLNILSPTPTNYELANGDILTIRCAGTTATFYFYVRAGVTFRTTTEANSSSCGYQAPETRSCTLLVPSVTVNYDQATVNCTNFVGPLEYSLDGGITRQRSPLFTELSAGSYAVKVYDLGASLPGCNNTRAFTVSDTAPPGQVARVADLPAFCFAGNPVIVTATAAVPYHNVMVQVWVETSHRSGSYALAYEAQRRSDAQSIVRLDVHDVLSAQLRPELAMATTWSTLTQPVRNWFVRVADVLPQNGKPGTWATSTNSVVVAGGLAPEPLQAGADYWSTARDSRRYHTWQPSRKRVGPRHVELLQFLTHDDTDDAIRVQPYDAEGEPMPPATFAVPAAPATPANVANIVAPPPLLPAQRVRLVQLRLNLASYPDAHQLVLDMASAADLAANDDAGTTADYFAQNRVLDVATDAEPRQLIYQNSLGGHDTLALFGKMSAKLTLDATAVEAYQHLNGTPTAALSKSWPGPGTTPVYSLSTGWLSNDWLEYLQELVQPGRDVYEYYAGQLRRVLITLKELPTYQEANTLSAAVLEYRPALTNEFYTDYARNTNRNPAVGTGW